MATERKTLLLRLDPTIPKKDLAKMQKQLQGIYESDWDAEREIVLAEPFMS